MITVTKSNKRYSLEGVDFDLSESLDSLMKEWSDADKASNEIKKASDKGRKYVYLDSGEQGAFLLDKDDRSIWCIKAYGVKHPDKLVGLLGQVTGADLVEKRFWSLK